MSPISVNCLSYSSGILYMFIIAICSIGGTYYFLRKKNNLALNSLANYLSNALSSTSHTDHLAMLERLSKTDLSKIATPLFKLLEKLSQASSQAPEQVKQLLHSNLLPIYNELGGLEDEIFSVSSVKTEKVDLEAMHHQIKRIKGSIAQKKNNTQVVAEEIFQITQNI